MIHKERISLTEKEKENEDDLPFGPRVVNVNYNAYNSSIDSRLSGIKDLKNSSLKNSFTGGEIGSSKSHMGALQKKTVTFDLRDQTFFIKSYKTYNRTGQHVNRCMCRLF